VTSYYYRSVREGERVRKEYVGGGALGEVAAEFDEAKRRQREEESAYWREERKRFERSAAFLQELEAAAQILIRAQLLVTGFRKWKGQWRQKRERS